MSRKADELLAESAETFRQRREVYGENWRALGRVFAALFPNGVTLKTEDDFNRFHIFMLGIVKDTRYVENWAKGGHQDSVRDGTVYHAMLEAIDEEVAERAK